MFVICFPKQVVVGGLGDRILGLISIKLMSKLLNRPFYILWTKEDIRPYIDYSKYDFELITGITGKAKIYKYIDRPDKIKHSLMLSNEFFNDADINMFYMNSEVSQYLYKNELFKDRNYLEDIMNEYQTLYSHVLIPTEDLQNKVKTYVQDKKNIVGVQIRCGDTYMLTNIGEPNNNINTVNNLTTILQNIKTACDSNYPNPDESYHIFITSDYDKAFSIAQTVWPKEKIIYNDDIIQHIDRPPISQDTSKIWVDSIILSQHTCELYISEESNFGRIAALSAPKCMKVYNLDCKPLDKISLLSKHECLFSN